MTLPRPAGRLTSFSEHATIEGSGIKRMRMNRHDDSQRSGRLVNVTGGPAPPSNSLYEKQLTPPAGKYSVYRCGSSGHNRNGVLRNEVWEDSGEVRMGARRHAGAR